MMTLEQQRIAIAEWKGWKMQSHPDRIEKVKGWTRPEHWVLNPEGLPCFDFDIPNYPFDLNAMHKAEEHLLVLHDVKLTDGIRPINDGTGKYMHELDLITKSEHSQGSLLWHGTFHWLHATAAQRSEALCRTLWPERWVA